MYLVNPMYFISNVIYIVPERSYILIEKSCWNTIVHLIFKRRKPSLADIRSLKHLCYSVYVTYMGTGRVDYKFFNSQIALLQDKEEEFKVFQQRSVVTVPTSDVVKLETNEENFFYEDEFIKDSDSTTTSLLSVDDHASINSILTKRSGLMAKLEETINYYLALSPETKNLVDVIGYGRILSLFKVFLSSKELSLKNKFEYQFFLMISNEIAKANLTFNYTTFYYCDCCLTINCHLNWKFPNKRDGSKKSEFREAHVGQIRYFVDYQPIDKVTISMSQNEIDTSVQQPDLSFPTNQLSQIFDSTLPVNELLTVEDTFLYVKTVLYDKVIKIHIFNTTDVRKILKDITFSYLLTSDIHTSTLWKEVTAATASFKMDPKNAFVKYVIFQWCKVYKVDISYISDFFNYSENNLTYQEMMDYFVSAPSLEQAQEIEKNVLDGIEALINKNLGF